MKKYHPYFVVWELTSECNFHCLHCYNGQVEAAAFDINKAIDTCEQLASLGVKTVLLSGGEILLSDIWSSVALKLYELGIQTGIISNGWFFDDKTIKQVVACKIDWVGFSIDGIEETHDSIRQKGSLKRVLRAIRGLNEQKIQTSISTAVNKKNIEELPAIYSLLCEHNVGAWQMQLAVPEGNLDNKPGSIMLDPAQIDTIIDFAHSIYQNSPLEVYLGDCVGHYNFKEIEVRSYRSLPQFGVSTYIHGCAAGKNVFGIKANGDITGCISLSKSHFVEGNIRDKSLSEVWYGENSFSWNRNMSKDALRGFCSECQYATYCLGGCPSLKFDKQCNPIENNHCSYSHAVKQERKKISEITDQLLLIASGREAKEIGNHQIAKEYFKRALELESNQTIEREFGEMESR